MFILQYYAIKLQNKYCHSGINGATLKEHGLGLETQNSNHMANKPITMSKLRLILQFRKQGLSARDISIRLSMSRKTVNNYVQKFSDSKISLDKLTKMSDEQLSGIALAEEYPIEKDPRYSYIQQHMNYYVDELGSGKTTKMVLWEEYRQKVPDGYGRTQFYEHLRSYQKRFQAVMHFEHEPGKVMEFDFAGDPASYLDLSTGEIVKCPLLVCQLTCSGQTYIEALPNMKRLVLLAALGRALEFFGGVPKVVRCDNLKQFVKKANIYEPTFDELADQWSVHYNTFLSAARVRKPRDKAKVESMVNTVYKRVYAPLRHMDFHSLSALNAGLYTQTHKLNLRNLQGRDYSRSDIFNTLEKKHLSALPLESFVPKAKRSAKVGKNYHIILGEDRHSYSVPCEYIGQQVDVVYDTDDVEIYRKMKRIASFKRNYTRFGFTTLKEHMPSNHQHMIERKGWNNEHFISKARAIGPFTVQAIEVILKNRTFEQQTYTSCLGTIKLGDKYGNHRLEAASKRALVGGKVNYGILKRILEKKLDQEELQTPIDFTLPTHENLRGSGEYS